MAAVGPVEKRERIRGLDVLRGVALLGILVVNAQQLFQPWLYGNDPVAVIPGESGVWWTWAVVHMLFDTKFLALFTLLFGVGFALQAGRAEARDPNGFRRVYLRRLSLLAIFGLIHGLFFYAADVLILYAVTGFALFRWRSWSASRMLAVGSAMLLATVIWHDIISTLSSVRVTATLGSFLVFALVARLLADRRPRLFLPVSLALLAGFAVEQQRAVPFKGGGAGRFEEKQAIAATLAAEPGDFVLVDGTRHETPLSRDAIASLDASTSRIDTVRLEQIAYQQGPAWLTLRARSRQLGGIMLFFTFFLFWRSLAVFLIGSGLARWGALQPTHAGSWRRAVLYGLGIGLPLSALGTWLTASSHLADHRLFRYASTLHDVSSFFIAAGIAGAVLLWSNSGQLRAAQQALAGVGRMALTGYVGQSVVMSLLACWYGLGLYGRVSRIDQLVLVGCVFSLQLVCCRAWLRSFRMGPLEWVWRCVSYWSFLPLRREVPPSSLELGVPLVEGATQK